MGLKPLGPYEGSSSLWLEFWIIYLSFLDPPHLTHPTPLTILLSEGPSLFVVYIRVSPHTRTTRTLDLRGHNDHTFHIPFCPILSDRSSPVLPGTSSDIPKWVNDSCRS